MWVLEVQARVVTCTVRIFPNEASYYLHKSTSPYEKLHSSVKTQIFASQQLSCKGSKWLKFWFLVEYIEDHRLLLSGMSVDYGTSYERYLEKLSSLPIIRDMLQKGGWGIFAPSKIWSKFLLLSNFLALSY